MAAQKKPKKTLSAKVEKIIKPVNGDPEEAQIGIEDGEHLYREIRVENRLSDEHGNEVQLKENAPVDVTIEADEQNTTKKKGT